MLSVEKVFVQYRRRGCSELTCRRLVIVGHRKIVNCLHRRALCNGHEESYVLDMKKGTLIAYRISLFAFPCSHWPDSLSLISTSHLALSRCSIRISWENEWVNEWMMMLEVNWLFHQRTGLWEWGRLSICLWFYPQCLEYRKIKKFISLCWEEVEPGFKCRSIWLQSSQLGHSTPRGKSQVYLGIKKGWWQNWNRD